LNRVAKSGDDMLLGSKFEAGKLTDAEKLHYAKQALWDMEVAAGRGTNEARLIADMRKRLTNDVLDNIPDYKQARQTWSGGMGTKEAGELGLDFFKMTSKPQEWIDAVNALNDHDKEIVKMAVVNAATDKAGSVKNNLSTAGILTQDQNRQRMLKALVGDDVVNDLVANADKWGRFRRTTNRMEGSQTGERQQTEAEMQREARSLLDPKGAVVNALLSHLTPNGRRMADVEVANEIGNILLNPNLSEREIINILTVPQRPAPYASKVAGVGFAPVQQVGIERMRE